MEINLGWQRYLFQVEYTLLSVMVLAVVEKELHLLKTTALQLHHHIHGTAHLALIL